jgi:hypothetical protein
MGWHGSGHRRNQAHAMHEDVCGQWGRDSSLPSEVPTTNHDLSPFLSDTGPQSEESRGASETFVAGTVAGTGRGGRG